MAERRVQIGVAGNVTRASVKARRTEKRWRLEDLSVRLTELGHPMSKATLSQIETGGRRIDIDSLVALAAALDVPLERLLPHERPYDDPNDATAYAEFLRIEALPEAEREAIYDAQENERREADRIDAEKLRRVREILDSPL